MSLQSEDTFPREDGSHNNLSQPLPSTNNNHGRRKLFTADDLGLLISKTFLNPVLTVPLALFIRYTALGRAFTHDPATTAWYIGLLAIIGFIKEVSEWLDRGVMNNWVEDTYDWNKELVVVTGGSDGIGAYIVKLLSENGIEVCILDIQEPKYDLPPNIHFYNCDLATPTAIASTASQIRTEQGNPTILINNAGLMRGGPVPSLSASDIRTTFAVNTLSHYHLARAFLPSMVKQNHGMLVTVASVSGCLLAPSMTLYGASKAAAIAFHEGLAAELATVLAAPRVRTVLVAPGHTATALAEGFDAGDGWLMYALDPETVGRAIVDAVMEGRSREFVLPLGNHWIVAVVGVVPAWVRYRFRQRLVKVMKGFRGRQVSQPSEGKKAA
ncbi:NAD(P)-binding protein [Patellaria atrata CBS 101060]|uniref:Short-chain dehydrogenase/reductase 3 n=1 Tax=Patellaria atrata CBS 101060 TaxID=1346257 RepID=A0A9P4VM41_9PEZI|nr:NAD(P)-binding protein [Patellaria atrata CBS 101060]